MGVFRNLVLSAAIVLTLNAGYNAVQNHRLVRGLEKSGYEIHNCSPNRPDVCIYKVYDKGDWISLGKLRTSLSPFSENVFYSNWSGFPTLTGQRKADHDALIDLLRQYKVPVNVL